RPTRSGARRARLRGMFRITRPTVSGALSFVARLKLTDQGGSSMKLLGVKVLLGIVVACGCEARPLVGEPSPPVGPDNPTTPTTDTTTTTTTPTTDTTPTTTAPTAPVDTPDAEQSLMARWNGLPGAPVDGLA